MKIKVTSVSVSKKGKTWIQCEVVEGPIGPDLGGIYDCKYDQESTRRGTYSKQKTTKQSEEEQSHES